MPTPQDRDADSDTDTDTVSMDIDSPSFSASLSSWDSMHTVVMIDVEHETDDMDVEVRFEDEVGVSDNAEANSPHFGNDPFLGSLSSFMPSLIGRYIGDDENQHVVPYDWGTPGPDNGGLFVEDLWTSQGYDYGRRLDEAYAQASLNSPLGGDWVHGTEGVPFPLSTVIEEPLPVVDRKGKGKQQMVDVCLEDFSNELPSLTGHFQDLRVGGDVDVNPVFECLSTATRQLSALLNRDGSSAPDAGPVRTTNVFSSNSFQFEYLSAFDKEPFYDRLSQRNVPGSDISDPNWLENRLKELKMRLMQTKNERKPTFTPQTPRTPSKSFDETDKNARERYTYTPADEEVLSPLIGCDLSIQDPFAMPGDTSSTPTHVPELRFKDLYVADTPLEHSRKRSDHCSPASPTRAWTASQPKSELECRRPKPLVKPPPKPKPELALPQPVVKPKLRICTPPRPREEPHVVTPVRRVPADVPETGGKILLWEPRPRTSKVATTTTIAMLTPPPTPPKKTKKLKSKSKSKSKALSKISESVVGEVIKPIPQPPPATAAVEKVPIKEPNQEDECIFPGAYPLDEQVAPNVSSPTAPERSILQWVIEIVWGW